MSSRCRRRRAPHVRDFAPVCVCERVCSGYL